MTNDTTSKEHKLATARVGEHSVSSDEHSSAIYASASDLRRTTRISWGGVLAGSLVAIAAQVLLSLLGLGIGLYSVDFMAQNPIYGIPTTMGVWWVLSGIVAMFIGGWVAARMAGLSARGDSILNGVVTWASVVIVSGLLLTTTVGRIANYTFSTVGNALEMTGQAAIATADSVFPRRVALRPTLVMPEEMSLQDIEKEFYGLANATGKEELKPDQIQDDIASFRQTLRTRFREALLDPDKLDENTKQVWDKISTLLREDVQAIDKQAVVNVLTQETQLSKSEAQKLVDAWSQELQNLSKQAEESYNDLEQEATQLAEELPEEAATAGNYLTHTLASASLWSFFIMVLGLAAAGAGGAAGARKTMQKS